MIAAREHLREHFARSGLADLVIPFSRGTYNQQATVAENLMFGVPRDPSLTDPRRLASVRLFREALERVKLLDDLDRMGVAIAQNLKDIFADVPPGHPLFRRFSLITPDALPDYLRRLARLPAEGRLDEADSVAFLALALAYVEPRMRFGLLDQPLKLRIVGARGVVQAFMHGHDGCDIESYDPNRINRAARCSTTSCSAASTRPGCTARRSSSARPGCSASSTSSARSRDAGSTGRSAIAASSSPIGCASGSAWAGRCCATPEILVVDRVSEQLERGVETLLDVTAAVLPRASLVASCRAKPTPPVSPRGCRCGPNESRLRNAAE